MTGTASPPSDHRDGLILGVDPGLRATGYGLIAQNGNDIEAIDFGVSLSLRLPLSERLATLFSVCGCNRDTAGLPSSSRLSQPMRIGMAIGGRVLASV
jgi:hypothetical protein